jgi:hypothetical protein
MQQVGSPAGFLLGLFLDPEDEGSPSVDFLNLMEEHKLCFRTNF